MRLVFIAMGMLIAVGSISGVTFATATAVGSSTVNKATPTSPDCSGFVGYKSAIKEDDATSGGAFHEEHKYASESNGASSQVAPPSSASGDKENTMTETIGTDGNNGSYTFKIDEKNWGTSSSSVSGGSTLSWSWEVKMTTLSIVIDGVSVPGYDPKDISQGHTRTNLGSGSHTYSAPENQQQYSLIGQGSGEIEANTVHTYTLKIRTKVSWSGTNPTQQSQYTFSGGFYITPRITGSVS